MINRASRIEPPGKLTVVFLFRLASDVVGKTIGCNFVNGSYFKCAGMVFFVAELEC